MERDILVVDDEPQMLIALSAILSRKGYRVTTTASSREALEILREKHYDLVISDLRMPNLDGIELLKRVRSLNSGSAVILLTAFGTVPNAVEAMKLGALDYLVKPFSSEELERVVEAALSHRAPSGSGQRIITCNPAMLRLLELARQVASCDATVLIQAESGTGKELLAQLIHKQSPRSKGPFIAVNCAAIPDNLLESELFGYEKGAFTGATAARPGKFELADSGTLLLDEVGEMPSQLQAKILRVLQEKEVERIGRPRPVKIDVRVVATTNRDLAQMVKRGEFREDLFYRLNVIPLAIPPLRERKEDIPLLVSYFCSRHGAAERRFSDETIALLCKYHWPGNVRELENVVQRTLVLSKQTVIPPSDLFLGEVSAEKAFEIKPGISLRELEEKLIALTLAETRGNRTRAAEILGISRRTLINKIQEYGMAVKKMPSASEALRG